MDEQQNIIYRTADGHASVAADGKNYNVVFYSLEMIIAVKMEVDFQTTMNNSKQLLIRFSTYKIRADSVN